MNERVERSAAFTEWRTQEAGSAREMELVPGVPADLSRSVDRYGSLITVEPTTWLVCFVPGLAKQWWHRFAHDTHKHVYAMRALDNGDWLVVESWWTRLWVCVLPSPQAMRFLRWAGTGDVLAATEKVPGEGSQLRGWSNCAVLAAFVLGRKSRSWTPHGFYLELVRDGAEHQDVEALIVDQVRKVVDSKRSNVLDIDVALIDKPLPDILFHVGRNMMQAFTSPDVLNLCYTALIESERYPGITRAYHEHGMVPALTALRGILDRANDAGHARIPDPWLAANRFMAMLRGTVQLEVAIGLRAPPTIDEIEAQVRSIVRIFLHGTVASSAGAGVLTKPEAS